MSKRERGVVSCVHQSGNYGFIQKDSHTSYFFHRNDLTVDSIGRRILMKDAEVSFEIAVVDGRQRAVCVENCFGEDVNPQEHREVSKLVMWNGKYGFLLRASLDRIPLFLQNICEFNENTKAQLTVGLNVSHGVAHQTTDPNLWYATECVLHLDEVFGESIEPVEPAVVEQSIFTDQEKKMSLRQLIAKKSS